MSTKAKIIEGGVYSDERGMVRFVNEFDMSQVKRMYHIIHADEDLIRGWQGHLKESKWFCCVRGSWCINVISFQNGTISTKEAIRQEFSLDSNESKILYVPGGNITGFKALEKHSGIIVYSDMSVRESKEDDYRFDLLKWNFKQCK